MLFSACLNGSSRPHTAKAFEQQDGDGASNVIKHTPREAAPQGELGDTYTVPHKTNKSAKSIRSSAAETMVQSIDELSSTLKEGKMAVGVYETQMI